MKRGTSKAIRIKQETLAIVTKLLPSLNREKGDEGGAVNYLLKLGIEAFRKKH